MRRLSSLLALATLTALLGTGGVFAQDDGERRVVYLAGSCTACHAGTAAEQAIPGLRGRTADDLMVAMQAFKSGQRKDQVMATVAASLSDEELDMLARYFAAQSKEGAAP